MPHPFRFGIVCGASGRDDLTATAREAEQRGYSTLAMTDHLDLSGAHTARLAWLPALAAAAMATRTLRLTTMVANHDLHHPAVLAREAATLDILSDGRFELGLGAGWNPVEYSWAGIALDPPGVRIARLAEYTEVVRGLLAPDDLPFTFAGEHLHITEMPRLPHPVQARLPLMLGGAQRRMLELAARTADIVNLLTLRDAGSADEVYAQKLEWVRSAAPGRDPEIASPVVLVATTADDPAAAVEAALPHSPFAQHVAQNSSVEAVARAPHVLAGSTGRIVEELHRRREAFGVSYYLVPDDAMPDLQPVLDALA